MKSLYKYIYMYAIIIATLFSCSDDVKDDSSIYQGTYLGSNLELTISGVQTTGKVLGINKKGELILQYIIPGESVIDIPLTLKGEWLEGSAAITNGSVNAKGYVKDKKLNMSLAINITSPIVGTWQMSPLKTDTEGAIISSPIYINAQPANTIVNFMGKEITLYELSNQLETMLGNYAAVIESVTFKEDGFIVFKYRDSKLASLPEGYIQYSIKDNTIYIMPNLIKIFELTNATTESRSEMEVVSEILSMLTEGAPLTWNIDNNNLTIYATKKIINPYFVMLKELLPLLPIDNEWVKTVDEYFPYIYKIFQTTTTVDIGVSLTK